MTVIRKPEKTYSAPPEGLWPAICVDEVDLGLQPTQWGPKYKVELRFQLDVTDDDGKSLVDPKNGHPYIVRQRFTASLGEKSKLRPILESWRSKKFTKAELEAFDIGVLVGVCAQVQVVHNVADDGEVYGNISAIVPYPKGVPKLTVDPSYTREKDRTQRQEYGRTAAASAGAIASYKGMDEDVPF